MDQHVTYKHIKSDNADGGTVTPLHRTPIASIYENLQQAIIDTFSNPYTIEQLQSPEIREHYIRPIYKYLSKLNNKAVVLICLMNFNDFKKKSEQDIGFSRVFLTRANVCEILAIDLLSIYRDDLGQLVQVLTYEFDPCQEEGQRDTVSGVEHSDEPEEMDEEQQQPQTPLLNRFQNDPNNKNKQSAFQVACRAGAKKFTSQSLVQEITYKIWCGEVVYYEKQIDSDLYYYLNECHQFDEDTLATLSEEVTFHKQLPKRFGSIFRVSRLRVPVYQNLLNIVFFATFLIVYSIVLNRKLVEFGFLELFMHLMVLAYTVDEIRQMIDGGFEFYFQNVWNYLDIGIYLISISFFILRIKAYLNHSTHLHDMAFDLLACNAILLWPRMLSILDRYQFFGCLIITLKHMFLDATLFMVIFFVFFIGFYQAIYHLAPEDKFSPWDIFWTMLRIFFGSSYLGFDLAFRFNPYFGPIIMIAFVAISVLFLMTILISIFNESFAAIAKNAQEEHHFNFTVKVMEIVQSDSLFPFVPPFNLFHFIFILPLYPLVSDRSYAKLNRFLMRIVFAPFLIAIFVYDTMWVTPSTSRQNSNASIPSVHHSSHTPDSSHPSTSNNATAISSPNNLRALISSPENLQKSLNLLSTSDDHVLALQLKCDRLEAKLDSVLTLLQHQHHQIQQLQQPSKSKNTNK